ncbi:MAG: nucleotide exchange factor GrpE [Thermoplasmatales archaeon]|nr:MAG: nucleotide exchange factor GrpE [Thermoplasmatales archaeon]
MSDKKLTGKKKDSSNKKADTFRNEIKKLKQEIKEKENKLLRSYADFQNYQKRMQKELKLKGEEIKRKYLLELIDLNELLKKAYGDDDPKTGLKLMLNNIEKFFEQEQIKHINCIGKKFDHNLHHAITAIEKEDCDDQTIIEEVKKGYMINDKILRPSQVIVAKKKIE